jgi:hypothetical protein
MVRDASKALRHLLAENAMQHGVDVKGKCRIGVRAT